MIGRRVIPCLLLNEGGLYKTVRFLNRTYVGDPINVLRVFNDKEVDEIIVLDIGATKAGRSIAFEMISDFASECFMPLCYGGGIRSMDDMRRLFDLGIEKVSLNTASVEDPDLVSDAAATFGSQSIVASIDVKTLRLRGASVMIRGGSQRSSRGTIEHARDMAARGAGEIMLTSIDREGTASGFDLELVRSVTSVVDIPVIAHGGAGTLRDLAEAFDAGASAAAAGSLFVFQGPHRAVLINYPTQEEQQEAFYAVPSADGA